MKAEELLPDDLWAVIEPLLPVRKRRKRHAGRKPKDPRLVLTGILFVLKTGIPWSLLPQELNWGSGMTCWRYLKYWHKKGVWKKVHGVLLDRLRGAEKIDFSRGLVDSSTTKAPLGGHGAEPYRSP
jgi:transposase